jgi:hypothetical protein
MRTRTARDGAFVVVKSRKEDRVRLSGLLRRLCGKALIAAAFTFSLLTPVSAAEQPPNFIVIFTDDLGYGDLPSYGNSTIRTPRLDQMAAEGVRLTEFYSAAPTCTPARAALLTGRYPKRSGLVRVLAPWERAGLPLSEITLA